MPALIANYTPTADASFLAQDSQIMKVYTVNKLSYPSSISLRNWKESEGGLINSRVFELLNKIEALEDNWDGDGAIVPNAQSLQLTDGIVKFMEASGQKIYNVAPGPEGEIMLDFRGKKKSLELLFYPDKMKYIMFSDIEPPKQGKFEMELLPKLLEWLNN